MTYFGAGLGVLGGYVTARTQEKQAATTGEVAPSIQADMVKALVEKK